MPKPEGDGDEADADDLVEQPLAIVVSTPGSSGTVRLTAKQNVLTF